MELEETTQIARIVQSTVIVIGTIWAYVRIWRQGLLRPRIEMDIQSEQFNPIGNEIPIDFSVFIDNKGLVKHKFKSILFRVRSIEKNEKLENFKKTKRLNFPHMILQDDLVYENYGHVFVEPGVTQKLSYIAKLPPNLSLIMVRVEFFYKKQNFKTKKRVGKSHSVEKVFQVETTTEQRSTLAPNS